MNQVPAYKLVELRADIMDLLCSQSHPFGGFYIGSLKDGYERLRETGHFEVLKDRMPSYSLNSYITRSNVSMMFLMIVVLDIEQQLEERFPEIVIDTVIDWEARLEGKQP